MWCHYNNSVDNEAIYGKLYNWFAVKLLQMDIDYYNAANPTTPWGWRVPNQADFNTLATTLGGASVAGGKMKIPGTLLNIAPNTNATNSSGLSIIGIGKRHEGGSFASGTIYNRGIDSTMEISNLETVGFGGTYNSLGGPLRLIKS